MNPDFMFSLFGLESDDELCSVRQRIIQWVYSNYTKFDKSTFVALAIKDIHIHT